MGTGVHRAFYEVGGADSPSFQVVQRLCTGYSGGGVELLRGSRRGADGRRAGFQTFLAQHVITHWLACREHPLSDELTEQAVQTMKGALHKCLWTVAART